MTGITTDRRITAADIAREVGVSRTTVGFVLNATPGQTISPATTRKVLDAAERLGYRPHLAAQALARGRTNIVLLVLPDWPVDYSMRRHLDEASIALDRAGYSLVTMSPLPGGHARPLWESLQPDVVLGMMPFTPERYEQIRAAGIAAVIPEPNDVPTTETLANYSQGARLQVECLATLGHRRLAYAASQDPRVAELVTARHAVAAAEAQDRGVELTEAVPVTPGSAVELTGTWHRAGITGVVAFNDDVAALVVGAALRLGLRVPDDLAVVGHDDSPLASVFVPSITSVHVDDEGLGRYVAGLALAAATGSPPPEVQLTPRITLVVRESSG